MKGPTFKEYNSLSQHEKHVRHWQRKNFIGVLCKEMRMTFIGLMGVHFNFLGYLKVVGFQDFVVVDHYPKCDFVNVSQVHCVMKP
jgi:hypothetical protein